MKIASYVGCRENQNILYFQQNFPLISLLFTRRCGQTWHSPTRHRWQCNTAFAFCVLGN